MNNYIFTSESVSDGHPDKVSDQISDALVDAGLANGDETTRVAVETLVTTNHVTVAGEVKNFNVDNVEAIIREKVKDIGYEQDGFHWENLKIYNELHAQSLVQVTRVLCLVMLVTKTKHTCQHLFTTVMRF